MNNSHSHRQDEELASARQLYQELVWRLAFLKEKGSEQDPEPTEQQIWDWYKQVSNPSSTSFMGERGNKAKSITQYFQQLFPDQTQQFGPACLETGMADSLGQVHSQPLMINHDTLAASLSDPRLGLNVVYYEQDMTFYYSEPFHTIFRPVSPDRLQALYRGLILRSAALLTITNAKLNVWAEFRSDKNCRLIIQRAKAILSVSNDFFSPTSKYQRIRGVELLERVARRFVGEMLTSGPGEMLKLADAFMAFRGLLRASELPDIKRSDFKAVVVPLIREQFDVALRNDLPGLDGSGVRGWKNVRLIQSAPGLN